ncbi:hypothetical protein A2W24_03855 [Microgenomates group bacterium RBG_16_45_19]|nr:MAG: hypothetical protein A2W24_03855 [Microgenomates group bacterium RBG_16_45_19]
MKNGLRFAVLGAGHGGYAMAADLSLAGYEVNLFNRSPKPIEAIRKRGGIEITGEAVYGEGFAKVKATTDMGEAIGDVDIIMITVPAFGHEFMIDKSIPHLKDEQIIVFNTGNFASLRLGHKLRKIGKKNVLAETSILIYSSRITGPTSVFVDGLKRKLPIAAFPSKKTKEVLEVLGNVYPQLIAATNVLETSLENLNPIFHPAITLLNAGLTERTMGNYVFYKDGVGPGVGRTIQAVDDERTGVAKELGLRVTSTTEWLYLMYGAKGNNIYEAIQNCKPYLDEGERGPKDFHFRFVTEDVPYGLVPIASLGDLLGVHTPNIKAIIQLWSTINQTDYFKEGYTAKKLGLSGLTEQEIIKLATEGSL